MYRIHEFARLAGVTVKALRHYDRLGLLRPKRTEAGYRVYAERDLERLEQIVALKFVGLPLKRIKILLDRDPLQLGAALRLQRSVLEEKRRLLDRALHAIANCERAMQSGAAAPSVLRKIIEVMEVRTDTEFMRNYYREEAWALFQERHPVWPSQAWSDLFRDIEASLGADPSSGKAQELASRWRKLRVSDAGGDPRIHAGLIKAWRDRKYWPEAAQQHLSQFPLDRISTFIAQAFRAGRIRKYGEIPPARQLERFTLEEREHLALASVGLYFDLAESLELDPRCERAQALAAHWMELMESGTGSVAGSHEDYEKLIDWMRNWPEDFQSEVAALDMERIGEFVLKALRVAQPNAT